ncbi:MAG: penicillin acylase family protein, partial [Bacteroidota bacterium]|nr:penicillin acylase family protein [Bacteroidota bacterium]
NGLKEEVTVYRDSYGVPHIYAQSEEDLYLAVGYIQARDRFWQMDLLRRVTQGRLSEMFGKDMIDADVLFRALRISEKSEKIWAQMPENQKSMLTAYTKGVNQFLAEDDLGFEFTVLGYEPDRWTEQNSINLIGYMAWSLSTAWNTEPVFYKLQQKLSEEKFASLLQDMDIQKSIYPNFNLKGTLSDSSLLSASCKVAKLAPPVFNASNNWVVSGKKSTTGKPIFANDMHLGLMIPGVWTQMHQVVEGKLNVTGVVLPGQPAVVSGHNADIAWGMTNVMTDDIDFYAETVNPKNKNQYKFNGEWKDFEIKIEKIHTKEGEIIEKEIKFTHRGPVITGIKDTDDKVLSMHWLGNDDSNELRSLYLLNRAKNWEDFKDALKTFVSVAQNVNYADTEGNIGIYCCAGIPKRELPGWQIFPGDTDLYDWKEFVPFDSLPHAYNPERGYVLSANNKTANKDYPHYISAWFDNPNRAIRIEEMLTAKEKLSIEDFKKMHTDQHSVFARELTGSFLAVLSDEGLNDQQKKALKLLSAWDFNMEADKPESLIFDLTYVYLGKNILTDEMGEDLFAEYQKSDMPTSYIIRKIALNNGSPWCDDISTEETEDYAQMVNKSFRQAVDSIKAEYKKDIDYVTWGEAHKLKIQHPLGKVAALDIAFGLNRTYETGGSFHTVSPYSYDLKAGNFDANHGASQRHIYSTANFDESQVIIPTGVSGIPASKHYCDQTDDYINGVYHQDFFSKEEVTNNAEYRMTFLPK